MYYFEVIRQLHQEGLVHACREAWQQQGPSHRWQTTPAVTAAVQALLKRARELAPEEDIPKIITYLNMDI